MSEGRFNLQSPASDPQGQRLKHILFSPRLESLLEIEEYMFWIFFKDKERIFFFFYDFIYLFLEKGEGKKKEGNISVWLPPPFPLLGTWPATQACVLTATLWFTDWRSIHGGATPTRAVWDFF